ncbi:methylene-tetrahydrofolate reductase-like protein [Paenibacillus cellulosilyticus]|uniref:Methylene-tetrahydrofolate reductase-like protein n=1 Tax=Paenibacillus cellulosilyticus TaxID=375489 RepID=A0A2V2Z2K4_9BACL|nr:methylenetetrahydrofolate reductase [Paenibacillus cellulosilyticus]PWW02881.1 methylene-tetrahydrofolate reductase-like protein [Paenibacillus cellulosilyticus]QKS45794.1 methylenetetrahydrofolate reductase [Paenibacillus cellulosilyticus]
MFRESILNKKAGIITYGMTPPKESSSVEKIAEISHKQVERLKNVDIDALILYDVQEESDRVEEERPFPYMAMLDPETYSEQYLQALDVPKIIYRCVGKYSEAELTNWLKKSSDKDRFSVFVGASSSGQKVTLDLSEAYRLSGQHNCDLTFGGVIIPERHTKKKDEHMRVVNKMKHGCSFFVSQATYNVEASKSFLSDYYHYCNELEIEMVPILFNLAPCGSTKTLAFMKWLGISIPRWLENELKYSSDVLDKSIQLTNKIFEELLEFGLEKGIPVGCSVESVSTRKIEIEASIQMVKDIKSLIDKKQLVQIVR